MKSIVSNVDKFQDLYMTKVEVKLKSESIVRPGFGMVIGTEVASVKSELSENLYFRTGGV